MTQGPDKTQEILDRHDQFMTISYPRYPIAIASGSGSHFTDTAGKTYLDMFSGFGAGLLGHCHPDLVRAITEQANKLWHVGNLFHNEPQTLFAEDLAKHGFGGRSYFCHSGADANEAALKLARLYGREHPKGTQGRYRVISTYKSFHGRSFGTMVATGQERVRKGFQPFLSGYSQVPYNDLKAMREAIEPETVAILVEPIQGEGGINVPGDDYLPGLRKLCDEHDLLLIVDEVWTGGGRTGKYFAHQLWNIEPDIMTLAKGVGGGLPVGVMCAGKKAADMLNFARHGGTIHGTTLGGNCLSMAVAHEIFKVIDRDNLLEHAHKLGEHAMTRLRKFAQSNPVVRDVRGKGLFIGVELDCENKAAWFDSVKPIVDKCLAQGVLINGTQNTVLRLAPPMIMTQQELDGGLDVLEKVIAG